MSIEEEILEEFKTLSENDLQERLSYAKVKAHFGINFEDNLASISRIDKNYWIANDLDTKIQADIDFVLAGQKTWEEIIYPLPRQHSDNITLIDWRDRKKKLHSIFFDTSIAYAYLIKKRWPHGIICPFCNHEKIYHLSQSLPFKCAKCRKRFSAITNTLFGNTKLQLVKWFGAIYLLTSNKSRTLSIRQLGYCLDITYVTAWKMAKKINKTFGDKLMSNINHGLFQTVS